MEPKRAWKVSMIGSKGVGKSSLISRIIYGHDDLAYDPKSMKKKTVSYEKGNIRINADLFFLELDSANGSEKLLSGSNAIVVVTDVTNHESLAEADMLLKYMQNLAGKAVLIVVATKQDLRYEAQFWDKEIEELATKYGVKYKITSSKSGPEADEFLDTLVASLSDRFVKKGN